MRWNDVRFGTPIGPVGLELKVLSEPYKEMKSKNYLGILSENFAGIERRQARPLVLHPRSKCGASVAYAISLYRSELQLFKVGNDLIWAEKGCRPVFLLKTDDFHKYGYEYSLCGFSRTDTGWTRTTSEPIYSTIKDILGQTYTRNEWLPVVPKSRTYSHLQMSAASPEPAALSMLYHNMKSTLLPPYSKYEIDLIEMKGRFRFPPTLRYYLLNVSRNAFCQSSTHEFFGPLHLLTRWKEAAFIITGRVSLKSFSGSTYRVVGVSHVDVVVVSGDRYGQVLSTIDTGTNSRHVEKIANYLYRMKSDKERIERESSSGITFQSLVDENGYSCQKAGLSGFTIPLELRRRKSYIKTIIKVLHHRKTLESFAAIRAARCIQRQWRRSICDPQYEIARNRLLREYWELTIE